MIWGVALQFIFGLIVLRWDLGREVIQCLADKVTIFLGYTDAGSGFVYGYLVTDQNPSGIALGTIFAFQVPLITNSFKNVIIYFNLTTIKGVVSDLLLQLHGEHPLLLRSYAMDREENWMASSN